MSAMSTLSALSTIPTPSMRAWRVLVAAAGLALLAACGTPKTHYPPAAQAQEQQRAAEAEPVQTDSSATHQRLIEQMQREGLWYASLAHIDALEQRVGTSPAVLRLRGDALRQTGQAAASREAYEALIKTPGAGDASAGLHGLGLLAGAEGDFARAAQWIEQARQRTPTDPRVLGDLGYAQLRAGQIDEARVPLMQAAQLRPTDARLQMNLATWMLVKGDEAQAARVLDAAGANPAAREAVQQTAARVRQARVPAPLVPPAQPSSTASTPAPRQGQLSLRSSNWQEARRVHVGVRRADDAAPSP